MRILYVITKASWGGAQQYVYDLATAAKEAGHEVAVAYGEGGELVNRLEAGGIRTIALAGLARDVGLICEWRAFGALRELLRRERPDIVHLNSSKAGFTGALAARMAGVSKIIFTAHGWAFNEARPWWQRIVIYKLAWLTIFLSHTTICVSQAIRQDTRWMPFVRKKLVVVYNGVREPSYKTHDDARRALWPEHESGYWIGMLSELHPTKRVEDAVEALTLIHAEYPDTRLIVLGEGAERGKLEALIKARGLEDAVRLAGFVSLGDSYLPAFDLFLHTSRSESFSLAVAEAGLAGLPVVATEVGGIPEIVADGKTGLLIPPCAPRAIASAIESLIRDLGRAHKMGAALRASVHDRFNQDRMVNETLALYER